MRHASWLNCFAGRHQGEHAQCMHVAGGTWHASQIRSSQSSTRTNLPQGMGRGDGGGTEDKTVEQESTTDADSRRALLTRRSSPATFWKRDEPDCAHTERSENAGVWVEERYSREDDDLTAERQCHCRTKDGDAARTERSRLRATKREGYGVLTRMSFRSDEAYCSDAGHTKHAAAQFKSDARGMTEAPPDHDLARAPCPAIPFHDGRAKSRPFILVQHPCDALFKTRVKLHLVWGPEMRRNTGLEMMRRANRWSARAHRSQPRSSI